jgi:hypothetical protein
MDSDPMAVEILKPGEVLTACAACIHWFSVDEVVI